VLPFTSRLKRMVFSRCSTLPRDLEGVKKPSVLRFFSTLTKSRRAAGTSAGFVFSGVKSLFCKRRLLPKIKVDCYILQLQQQALVGVAKRTCQNLLQTNYLAEIAGVNQNSLGLNYGEFSLRYDGC